MATFEERRAHPRHSCRVPVTITAADFAWLVHIVDYSGGGVCIESTLQPALGSELDLRFRHPVDSRLVTTRGVVRHVGRPVDASGDTLAVGVQFAT